MDLTLVGAVVTILCVVFALGFVFGYSAGREDSKTLIHRQQLAWEQYLEVK